MANRIFRGRAYSENGWPYVDQGSCTWVDIPGTNGTVQLQIQNGPPLAIMRAFAADYHAYVEPIYNADSCCWTPDNDVDTSNHPGATAMDLRWKTHPFEKRGSFTAAQLAVIQELLDWYEGMVFWAGIDWKKLDGSRGGWGSPIDEMHWQMGYDTYDQKAGRPYPKVTDFVARKIRADGFSTFRRGTAPSADQNVELLAQVMGGAVPFERYRALFPAVSRCLNDCGCTTVDRIAMWTAQVGHESVGLLYMSEIWGPTAAQLTYQGRMGNVNPGDGYRYRGRGPIQVTGHDNYAELSRWAFGKGIVATPTFFIDDPDQLASDTYGFVGVTWYWTTQRPMNDAADARDIVRATQYVNGGQTGIDDRRSRYNRALTLGDQLLALTTTPEGDDFMPALNADEQREVLDLLRWLAAPGTGELRKKFPSRSPLRHLGEGLVDTAAGIDLNDDANDHVVLVKELAEVGDAGALSLLAEIADADPVRFPDRQQDRVLAQLIIAHIEATNPVVLQSFINARNGVQS